MSVFLDLFLTGLASARPAVTGLGEGLFYYATDTGVFSRIVSGAWVTYFTVGGAASGTWSIVGSWTFSSTVSQVTFTGLAGAAELLLTGSNVTKDQSRAFLAQVSTDNGSTWLNSVTDYRQLSSAGVETGVQNLDITATNTTAARSFALSLDAIAIAAQAVAFSSLIGQTTLINNAAAITALRVLLNGAGNLAGGSMTLRAR